MKKYIIALTLLAMTSCKTPQPKDDIKQHEIMTKEVKDGEVIYQTVEVIKYRECQVKPSKSGSGGNKDVQDPVQHEPTRTIIEKPEPKIVYVKRGVHPALSGTLGLAAGIGLQTVAYTFGFKFGLFGFFKWLFTLFMKWAKDQKLVDKVKKVVDRMSQAVKGWFR